MNTTRACGNVRPATSSLFPALYADTLTHVRKYVGLQFVHLHRDIMHNAHTHI